MILADITPVFKKKDLLNKENCRPISVLASITKIFEKLMPEQINGFIENVLSSYLCGYRKGFSTQLALLSLTEKLKKALDNINCFLVILIIDSIGQRLTRILVHGENCFKGFLKDLSFVLFFSIFI